MREQLKAFYRTYRNDYLSIAAYADHLHMSEEHVAVLVDIGRELQNEDAERAQVTSMPAGKVLAQSPALHGYVALYNGKRHELYASSSFKAFEAAVAHFNQPKSRRHMVSVSLTERPDGTEVIHTAVN